MNQKAQCSVGSTTLPSKTPAQSKQELRWGFTWGGGIRQLDMSAGHLIRQLVQMEGQEHIYCLLNL